MQIGNITYYNFLRKNKHITNSTSQKSLERFLHLEVFAAGARHRCHVPDVDQGCIFDRHGHKVSYSYTFQKKDDKLENKNFIQKWLLEVGMAETTAEKTTETRERSGWEEIWRSMPIPTFHQLLLH